MKLAISPETKVGDLLEAYPESENVLIRLAPKFKALRNPVLRRTVAKVTSLEQAARVGGIQVSELVLALRQELGVEGDTMGEGVSAGPDERPQWVDGAEPGATIDADELLSSGKTPVAEASQALAELGNGGILRITAEFQPAPLIDALRAKGHEVYASEVGTEAWEVWIRKG